MSQMSRLSESGFFAPVYRWLAVLLCIFVLAEVNYPMLTPQGDLAIFSLLGLALVFLQKLPVKKRWQKWLMGGVLLATVITFGFVVVQNEPFFGEFWLGGRSLGDRAGLEQAPDFWIGLAGLLIVLIAAWRAIGFTLPLLSGIFLLYAAFGPLMPDWFFPHRGYDWQRIVSQTFLHSQGVFGVALRVMFTYVFLFVLFGTLLSQTGATDFVINFARRIFRGSAGGPAKVAVLSSGLMGSLSGSAVANTATTGTFTIPLMRSAGFRPEIAGGVEAAASSGGALVPPIMGAGAYMMLEIIDPPVTYLQIIRAAILPAVLYYVALLFIVHLQAKKQGVTDVPDAPKNAGSRFPGVVFAAAFVALIVLLVVGFTPFRAVSLSLLVIVLVGALRPATRLSPKKIVAAAVEAAQSGVALVAAAACVGIILGVVTLTGIGSKLPAAILPLAQDNRLLALILLMISTIILGMGLPSAVCYLLMATLVGPVLGELGVVPLAAHLFIFYFGMMSMVTPPVALAAYTAAAIARSGIMATGLAAFRFSLVGFALPFAFVLRPELLLMNDFDNFADWLHVITQLLFSLTGIIALSAAIVGFGFTRLRFSTRFIGLIASLLLLLTPEDFADGWAQLGALTVTIAAAVVNFRKYRNQPTG